MSFRKSASSPRPAGKLELADDATLKAHLTAAFDELDADKRGKVSRAELRLAFLRLAWLAGLPEPGGSAELDRAVDEAFETGENEGDETGELDRDHFVALSLGLLNIVKIAATYAVAPLLLQVFTCGAMRYSPTSAEQRAEAALAEAAFKQMDRGGRGKLSKRDLLPVLAALGIEGTPPPQVAEATLSALLERYAAGAEEMGREQFNELFVQLVTGMADLLDTKEQPAFAREASIALSARSLRKILASKEPLQKMASESFADLDVSNAGQLSRADVMSGLRKGFMMWGLTPQQMDSLLSCHFTVADFDSSGFVDHGKFSALYPALLASLVEQLEQNPFVLKVSLLKDLPVGGGASG
ncbi:unnamed protein product [Closterium sp. Naga37s-1]|nr:unnamed protein product [Closterium sp. Naga37s-1]